MDVDVAVDVVDVDDGFVVLVLVDEVTSVHLEVVKDNDDDGVLIVL